MDLTGTQAMPSESIKITESKLTPWIVCFSAALFFFYEFIQMNMFNSVSSDLMQAFSINATQLGNLSSIYYYDLNIDWTPPTAIPSVFDGPAADISVVNTTKS